MQSVCASLVCFPSISLHIKYLFQGTQRQPSQARSNPGHKRVTVDDETPSHLLPWSQVIKRSREKAKRSKPPDAPILSRRAFCAADKRVVCEMLTENPDLTHQDVANHFGVDRSMISRVWAKKTQWLRSKHSGEHKFARKRYHTLRSLIYVRSAMHQGPAPLAD